MKRSNLSSIRAALQENDNRQVILKCAEYLWGEDDPGTQELKLMMHNGETASLMLEYFKLYAHLFDEDFGFGF